MDAHGFGRGVGTMTNTERPRERRRLWGVWELYVALAVFLATSSVVNWAVSSVGIVGTRVEAESQETTNAVLATRIESLERDSAINRSEHKEAILLLVGNLVASVLGIVTYWTMQRAKPLRGK